MSDIGICDVASVEVNITVMSANIQWSDVKTDFQE